MDPSMELMDRREDDERGSRFDGEFGVEVEVDATGWAADGRKYGEGGNDVLRSVTFDSRFAAVIVSPAGGPASP